MTNYERIKNMTKEELAHEMYLMSVWDKKEINKIIRNEEGLENWLLKWLDLYFKTDKKSYINVNDIVISKKNREVKYIVLGIDNNNNEVKCKRIDDLYNYTISYDDLEVIINAK